MTTSQKALLLVATLMITLLLGLRTGITYKLSEVTKPGGPKIGNTTLFLYGNTVLSSARPSSMNFLLHLGEYKFEAIAAVALLAGVGLIVLRRPRSHTGSRH